MMNTSLADEGDLLRVDELVPGPGPTPPDLRAVRAFDDFYREARTPVIGALTLTLRNPSLAAEAVDEAMARAFVAWASVGTYDNPAGWVYRVALNWSRSMFRRRRREDLGDVAELALLDADISVDLDRAIATLDLDHRAVVVLRHLLGYSTREVSAALDIAEGTVKSRLSRALDQLRHEMGSTDA